MPFVMKTFHRAVGAGGGVEQMREFEVAVVAERYWCSPRSFDSIFTEKKKDFTH